MSIMTIPLRYSFAAVAAALLGVALLALPGSPASAAGAPARVAQFGSNPGALQMYAYRPANLPTGAPLVVALHGCTQDATGYASGSGWTEVADDLGLAVVFAQQPSANNPSKCFNWFQPSDIARGQGEAASVASMVAYARTTWGTDAARTYVTGLSAGGATTSALLAAYPDLFAGGSIVAGIPVGCARSMVEAFSCQSSPPVRTPAAWGNAVREAAPSGTNAWPRVAIWHGSSDSVVVPANATASRDQWTNVHGLSQTPTATTALPGGTTRADYASGGTVRVSTFTVGGMGHATPNDPGTAETQCGTAGAYFADTICSSWYTAQFWGLTDGSEPEPTPTPTDPAPTPTDPAPSGCWTTSTYAHTQSGRAYQSFGRAYARGSNDDLGLWNTFVTASLERTGPDHYEKVPSC